MLVLLGVVAAGVGLSWLPAFASPHQATATFSMDSQLRRVAAALVDPQGSAAWHVLRGLACLALCASVVCLSCLVPLHGGLTGLIAHAPAEAVLMLGGWLPIGGYFAGRFLVGLLPGLASVWSPLLVWLGAGSAVYASLAMWKQTAFRHALAWWSVGQSGLWTAAIASMSRTGMIGGLLLACAHGVTLGCATALLKGGAPRRPYGRCEDSTIDTSRPTRSVGAMTAILAAMGLPGLALFAAQVVALVGLFRSHATAGLACWFALLLSSTVWLRWIISQPISRTRGSGLRPPSLEEHISASDRPLPHDTAEPGSQAERHVPAGFCGAPTTFRDSATKLATTAALLAALAVGVQPQAIVERIEPDLPRWLPVRRMEASALRSNPAGLRNQAQQPEWHRR